MEKSFVESFWVRLPLRRHREVQPMENNNSLLNQVTLDLKKGINSCGIRATLFLLGFWFFPPLPMHFYQKTVRCDGFFASGHYCVSDGLNTAILNQFL